MKRPTWWFSMPAMLSALDRNSNKQENKQDIDIAAA